MPRTCIECEINVSVNVVYTLDMPLILAKLTTAKYKCNRVNRTGAGNRLKLEKLRL